MEGLANLREGEKRSAFQRIPEDAQGLKTEGDGAGGRFLTA